MNTKTKRHNEKNYLLIKKQVAKRAILPTAIMLTLSVFGGQWLYFEAKDKITDIFSPKTLQAEATEPKMIDWVLAEVEKAGIDKTEALMIIQCESRQNPSAYNINKHADGTTSLDAGLWQINLYYHKDITLAQALDYKQATKKAIELYKQTNSWQKWSCAKILGL